MPFRRYRLSRGEAGRAILILAAIGLVSTGRLVVAAPSVSAADCPPPNLSVSPSSAPAGNYTTIVGHHWSHGCSPTYPGDADSGISVSATCKNGNFFGMGGSTTQADANFDFKIGTYAPRCDEGETVQFYAKSPYNGALADFTVTKQGTTRNQGVYDPGPSSAPNQAFAPAASSALADGTSPSAPATDGAHPSATSVVGAQSSTNGGGENTGAASDSRRVAESRPIAVQILHRNTSAGKLGAAVIAAALLICIALAGFLLGRRRARASS